jgi:hypothetical protein
MPEREGLRRRLPIHRRATSGRCALDDTRQAVATPPDLARDRPASAGQWRRDRVDGGHDRAWTMAHGGSREKRSKHLHVGA